MATATAEKTETISFHAPGEGLRLVVEPQEHRWTAGGTKSAVEGTGKHVEFKADGNGAQIYETDDPEVIAWMRGREGYGVKYFEVTPPKPEPGPTLIELSKLAANDDAEGILALYEAEESGHRRPEVLEAITAVANQLEAKAKTETKE